MIVIFGMKISSNIFRIKKNQFFLKKKKQKELSNDTTFVLSFLLRYSNLQLQKVGNRLRFEFVIIKIFFLFIVCLQNVRVHTNALKFQK